MLTEVPSATARPPQEGTPGPDRCGDVGARTELPLRLCFRLLCDLDLLIKEPD